MKSGGKQMMRRGTGTVYRIVVRSELGDKYAVAFEGVQMEARDGVTVLTGRIIDQPQLYGILERINGLGLELLSVEALPEGTRSSAREERVPKGPKV
jgi:hypothetical protein